MAKPIDWSFIRLLWCAGGLSNRQIVRQYNEANLDQDHWKPTVTEGAIRLKAKRNGWQKNLADRIKKEVREKLIRAHYAPERANTNPEDQDNEIVEQAAETIAQVIQLHRKDICKLKSQERDLLRRLREDEDQVIIGWYQGKPTEHTIKMGLEQRSRIYQRLVAAICQRIKLERLAWGIDEANPNSEIYERIEIIQNF